MCGVVGRKKDESAKKVVGFIDFVYSGSRGSLGSLRDDESESSLDNGRHPSYTTRGREELAGVLRGRCMPWYRDIIAIGFPW